MTTEQKAKAYDEAIEKSKEFYILCKKCGAKDTVDFLEDSFPELKESEDEKIRKVLKHYLEVRRCQTQSDEEYINCNNFLAWLEKQGKEDSSIQQAYEWGYTEGKRIERKHWVEKQKFSEDYNSIDPHFGKLINKVESKFKAGNWYQCIKDFFGKGVIFNKNTAYYCAKEGCLQNEYGCHIAIVKGLYDNFKLWTIDDAKKGDILADKYGVYIYDQLDISDESACVSICGYQYSDKKFEPESMICNKSDIHPATKEQRDLLFKKMKEAGYTFDFEKKELKKVEKKSQRMISAEAKEVMYDKPTDEDMKEALRTEYEKGRADAIAEMQKEWSEEDEEMFEYTISLLNYNLGCRKWLKSLKERYTWKPSDKQMHAFEQVYDWYNNNFAPSETLTSLYKDLEKLKGE